MIDETKDIYRPITQHQIDELTAIYDDYMRVVRSHERGLQKWSLNQWACAQIQAMCPDTLKLPWKAKPMTRQEKRQFADFIRDNNYGVGNKAYVVLRHVKTKENVAEPPIIALFPYLINSVNLQLPSPIERFVFFFHQDACFGNTEFYVDGRYKLVCIDEDRKDKLISDYLDDQKIPTEMYLAMRIAECFCDNDFEFNGAYTSASAEALASAKLAVNENTILELLGSFVEKLQNILRKRYDLQDAEEVFNKAEQEGLIHSSKDFQDYIQIRHFIRHQLDTLNELGRFSPSQSSKNAAVRTNYVNSYLKICDNKLNNRMTSYVDILHHMQQVIGTINTNRVIREVSESNVKFIARATEAYKQNENVRIELNYPLISNKHKSLSKSLKTISPQIKIIDDFSGEIEATDDINYYITRSRFLQKFHSLECLIMRYCLTRGYNFNNVDSWDYIAKIGLLSPQEFYIWKRYAYLRNLLSHNYFDERLRDMLRQKEQDYFKDAKILNDRIMNCGPKMMNKQDDVYNFVHDDRLFVSLNFKDHTISKNSICINPKQIKKAKKETYQNGVEFTLTDEYVVELKIPSGITINLNNQTIDWDKDTKWYINDDNNYVLKTRKNMLIANSNLRTLSIVAGNKNVPFCKCDNWLFDGQHKVALDDMHKIKEFKFKNAKYNTIQTIFCYFKNGYNTLLFNDGTCVLQSGPEIVVTHNGTALTYNNRQNFAATYNMIQSPVSQIINHGICR